MELIRKSREFSFFTVSLEAKASKTNLKLGGESGVSFRRLILNPKSWTLLMDIFPLKKGIISNLADKRVTLSISWPLWSSSNTSSIIIRFNRPILILPITTFVFKTSESSSATNTLIACWMFGIFSKTIVPIYTPSTIPTTQRTVFFSVLICDNFYFADKNIK